MPKNLTRDLCISAMAAFGAFTFSPFGKAETLSADAPGPAAAATQTYDALAARGRALHNDFEMVKFAGSNLTHLQDQLRPGPDMLEHSAALKEAYREHRTIVAANDEAIGNFHRDLLFAPHISEQDVHNLYTGPFQGTKYAHHYTEYMAYRDECRADVGADASFNSMNACMTAANDGEFGRNVTARALTAGGAFTGTLGFFFSLAGAGHLARRNRDQGRVKTARAALDATKNLLRPKDR